MKRIITILATFVFALASINSHAQALDEGNIVIDVYYGYVGPGLILASIASLEGQTNSLGTPYNPQTSVSGPIGIRGQYMVTPSFGVGIDANFERKTGSWSGASFDSSFNTIAVDGSYEVTKIKAMFRTSWEFVNTDKFTLNWANSFGFKGGSRVFSDEGGEIGEELPTRLIPIAVRSALGARFFFTDNIGAHFEIGVLGGGTMLGGISLKL